MVVAAAIFLMPIVLYAGSADSVFAFVTAIKTQLYMFNQIINDRAHWPEAASLVPSMKEALIRVMRNLDAVATIEPDEQSVWFLRLIKNMLGIAGDEAMSGKAPDSSTIVFVLPGVWGRSLSEVNEQKTLFLLFLVDQLCVDLKKVMSGVATLLGLQLPSVEGGGGTVPVTPGSPVDDPSFSSGADVKVNNIVTCTILGLLFFIIPSAMFIFNRSKEKKGMART